MKRPSDMAPKWPGASPRSALHELLATVWLSALLRDGFALTAASGRELFARITRGALECVLAGANLNRPLVRRPTTSRPASATSSWPASSDLSVRPDAPDGCACYAGAGLRLVTLSNGSADVAERLLTKAGIHREFEHLLPAAPETPPVGRPGGRGAGGPGGRAAAVAT